MRRLVFCCALALAAAIAPLIAPAPASASVAVRLSLDDLVRASRYVVVATAGERYSVWEDLAGGRRMVTYTRLSIDRSIVGQPSRDVWVRTLGGTIGSIGQYVSGEARLPAGSRSLLFLSEAAGTLVVAALGQGQYPIMPPTKLGDVPRLRPSADRPELVVPKGLAPHVGAAAVLSGATVDDAARVIERAKRTLDGAK
jgi:hypothetical protein